jgi:protein-L-isoaspartate(D-aspartate) O-methyltransferase
VRRIVLTAAVLLLGCRDGRRPPAAAAHDAAAVAVTDPWAAQRASMVDTQIAARGVTDARVLAAMRVVPRHELVPDASRADAYADRPLPIGWDQTI